MKAVLSFGMTLALVAFFQPAECAITAWLTPVIATPTGNAPLTNKINVGATVGTATGVSIIADSDDGGGVTAYTIESQVPAAPVLAISSAGLITVSSGSVTYTTGTTEFVLQVSANDAGGTASTGTMTLSINETPAITTHDATACIADNSEEGVDLIDLAATDSNTGTTITWDFFSGNSNSDFAISTTGLVQVAAGKTLAMETYATYTLLITAADDSSTPLTVTTTVTASVKTSCNGSAALTLSLMTILSALMLTKLT